VNLGRTSRRVRTGKEVTLSGLLRGGSAGRAQLGHALDQRPAGEMPAHPQALILLNGQFNEALPTELHAATISASSVAILDGRVAVIR
jgi:hypothetical protein